MNEKRYCKERKLTEALKKWQKDHNTLKAENKRIKEDYIDECHRHTENVCKLEAENAKLKVEIGKLETDLIVLTQTTNDNEKAMAKETLKSINYYEKEARKKLRAAIRSKVEDLYLRKALDWMTNIDKNRMIGIEDLIDEVLKIMDGGETQKGKRSGEQYSPACKDSNPSVEGKSRKGNCLPSTRPEKPKNEQARVSLFDWRCYVCGRPVGRRLCLFSLNRDTDRVFLICGAPSCVGQVESDDTSSVFVETSEVIGHASD